jgi:hypothetical protein
MLSNPPCSVRCSAGRDARLAFFMTSLFTPSADPVERASAVEEGIFLPIVNTGAELVDLGLNLLGADEDDSLIDFEGGDESDIGQAPDNTRLSDTDRQCRAKRFDVDRDRVAQMRRW